MICHSATDPQQLLIKNKRMIKQIAALLIVLMLVVPAAGATDYYEDEDSVTYSGRAYLIDPITGDKKLVDVELCPGKCALNYMCEDEQFCSSMILKRVIIFSVLGAFILALIIFVCVMVNECCCFKFRKQSLTKDDDFQRSVV